MASRSRPITPRPRGNFTNRIALPLVAAFALLLGLVGYTIWNGELRLPFGGGVVFSFGNQVHAAQRAGAQPMPAGTVAVYANPRALPAFTRITREHLLTGEGLHTVPVVATAIAANGLFAADAEGLQRLLGRVLKRDKPVNFAFSENDLLPVGTRPGLSAGIPPGKRGIWLDAEQVQGIAALRAGDLVDLVAAEPMAAPQAADPSVLGNIADPVLATSLRGLQLAGGNSATARSWVLARQALVVASPRRREADQGGNRRAGAPTGIEEVFLALLPEEIARCTQALARKVAIVAAPRSGQPDGTAADAGNEIADWTPPDPSAELRRLLLDGKQPALGRVELIRGTARGSVTVPTAAPPATSSTPQQPPR
jgi:hypothetical protein